MKKIKSIVLAFSTLLILSCLPGCGSRTAADTIIYGTIYMGEEESPASAMVIRDGKILYVGDTDGAKAYKATECIRLDDGQMAIPGMTDAHCHASNAWENRLYATYFADDDGKQEYIDKITAFVAQYPDREYYIARGWIDSQFDAIGPTAAELEGITDKPIIARDAGGHSLWCNQAAMDKAGVDSTTVSPAGGTIVKDTDGNPTGLFKEKAMNLIIDSVVGEIDKDYFIPCIRELMREYAENGYTALNEAMVNEFSNFYQIPRLEAYEELDCNGELNLYVQGSFMVGNRDDYKELLGMAISCRDSTKGGNFEVTDVKVFMDGVVEGGTAYISSPYFDIETGEVTENYGNTYWTTEEDFDKLTDIICIANKAGMPVHFHAIGDQAITNALGCIEQAADIIGIDTVRECRNIITHLQIVDDASFAKMEKYNVTANLNPWCCKDTGFYYETEVKLLGEERASQEYPNRTFLDNNIHIAFGTDYGSSYTYTFTDCFYTFATRMDPDNPVEDTLLNPFEKLTRAQVLDMMTVGSAYQMRREDTFGSFAQGMDATLVVLNQNILEVSDADLLETVVEKTMYQGKWTYSK